MFKSFKTLAVNLTSAVKVSTEEIRNSTTKDFAFNKEHKRTLQLAQLNVMHMCESTAFSVILKKCSEMPLGSWWTI